MWWETHLRGPPRNVRDAPFSNGIDDITICGGSRGCRDSAEVFSGILRYYGTKASVYYLENIFAFA